MTKIRTNIITPVNPESADFLPDHVLGIETGKIVLIEPYDPETHKDYQDKSDMVCLPGLIDLHVHLSQYDIRGLYRPALLPWLNDIVFPEEEKSADTSYAKPLARRFLEGLLREGTTTSVIYTAPYKEACEAAFETAQSMGVRAIIGMTLMDMNSPRRMQQTTDYAVQNSIEMFHKWSKSGLLDYIFTPRFAPTCSEAMMRVIGRFAHDNNARIQTHLSENRDEIAWVQKIFGLESYTDVYREYGILGKNTIMAHCIHLSDREMNMLAETDTRIAHCPDSNFYLKSGEYPLLKIKQHGIAYGLGSDVGAGTTVNMFYHAKMYNFRQMSIPILPADALYHITLGAAKVLNMEDRIGSVEIGKEADLIFLNNPSPDTSGMSDLLSQLVFFGHEFALREVYTAGNRLI
ncbi:MAG: guanine deaminase [Candidatus Cloacimonadaceae bacterium]|nr:guanine deaminase [Candidatus Cloacimonadaceae bacterium]